MLLLIGITDLAKGELYLGDPSRIGTRGSSVPHRIPVKIETPVTQVLQIHFLSCHCNAEFKCCTLIKIAVQGKTGDVPGTRIPAAQFIDDLIRFAIVTNQTHIEV